MIAMGTRESVVEKKPDVTSRPPNRRMVRIVVMSLWTTEPDHLINLFCGQGSELTIIGREFNICSVSIDEEIVCLQI